MVDLRSLFDKVQEGCESEVDITKVDTSDRVLWSPVDLNEKLDSNLNNLKEGIDEVEKYVKDLIEDTEALKEKLDELANSLY